MLLNLLFKSGPCAACFFYNNTHHQNFSLYNVMHLFSNINGQGDKPIKSWCFEYPSLKRFLICAYIMRWFLWSHTNMPRVYTAPGELNFRLDVVSGRLRLRKTHFMPIFSKKPPHTPLWPPFEKVNENVFRTHNGASHSCWTDSQFHAHFCMMMKLKATSGPPASDLISIFVFVEDDALYKIKMYFSVNSWFLSAVAWFFLLCFGF